jgi:hypothetical protein
MSRAYHMSVHISDYDRSRGTPIQDAAEKEWPFDDWDDDGEALHGYGDGSLAGGESEEEFTERLAKAVWQANGAYCGVAVDATYMESLPYEIHCMDENDYQRLMAGGPNLSPNPLVEQINGSDHPDC